MTDKSEKKQGNQYLSKIYSYERRPISDYPDKLAKYLCQKYIKKEKGKLLDVGCGRGDMLKAFKKNNFSVFGIDLSKESKEMCHPINVQNINLEDENFNYTEENFDIIFSKSLIEHLNNPINFMNSCKKLLSDSGCLVIMTPSWIHHGWGPFYLDHTHKTPFTLQSLRDLGSLAGFKNVKVEYFYQLPVVWRYSFFKIIARLVSFLKIPYLPMYEGLTSIKWPNFLNKFFRFSNEVMLIAVCKKK
ncbi:class I SAM-dependent methyltransferase [Candidatus Pelagibacter sp.]|jgi:SAM-dependent methyltransferase|nr:class I SAM-dependent methyltransferase [Candidatus Pelagibacter sp.]